MKTKLKTLWQQLLRSPREFPVELAMGVAFFIITVWKAESLEWNGGVQTGSMVNDDILWFFVPLIALTFWLHRVNRIVYILSFFFFLPLMVLNLRPYLFTFGFGFTYVLAGLLLILGNKKMDNRTFASNALHIVTQLFLGQLVCGIFTLAVFSITESFFYIFGINRTVNFYEYTLKFIWLVLAPQVCFTLVRQHEDEVAEPFKVLRIILNFILSPAVIIYTVILYTYFIKIAFEWNLPKGGVAWMVMGFIAVALAGMMAQSILSKRYYDWFYRYFALVAIPPLVMYWIGSVYRIQHYGFTESRFYLMVAGMLMSLFVLMLFKERTRRYQLMALILGAAIILFTYIPGISAKSIGLRSQKQRLAGIISDLKLADGKTGKLNDNLNLMQICKDSLLCERYKDACSVIDYVNDEMGNEAFEAQYGTWKYSAYSFNAWFNACEKTVEPSTLYKRNKPVELGEYTTLLPAQDYDCSFERKKITVRKGSAVVLEYPIGSVVRRNPAMLRHPEQLLTFRNDSLMLVLGSLDVADNKVVDVSTYRFMLLEKRKK